MRRKPAPPRVAPGPCFPVCFRARGGCQFPAAHQKCLSRAIFLTARGRRDGRKLRRKRKAHILADQIEIALVGIPKFGEALADLLDQNFRSGSASSQAYAFYAIEPRGINVRSRINQFGFDAAALGDFDEAIGIGTVLRANNEDQIHVLCDLFDGFLTILRGVADVVALGADDFGEFLAEAGDDFLRVVKAQGRLREEREFFGIGNFEGVYGFDGIHNDGAVGSFAGCADDFLMILVSDQDDGAILAGEFQCLKMDFGDEWAGGVNNLQRARFGLITNDRGNTVGAENENGAMGHFGNGFDENGAAAAELLDDVGVVDDFVMHVDGRAIGFEGEFDNVHGANHTGAKAAGPDSQENFSG